jgi:hypothetical protein
VASKPLGLALLRVLGAADRLLPLLEHPQHRALNFPHKSDSAFSKKKRPDVKLRTT